MVKSTLTVHDVDRKVLAIFDALAKAASQNAAGSVERILGSASGFLSEETHDALKSFHELYFGEQSAGQSTINDDVDCLIAAAQEALEKGLDPDEMLKQSGIGDEKERDRLALSGLQKKLEVVISLSDSVRDRLTPVLSAMQFEDALTQRLAHITFSWTRIIEALAGSKDVKFDGIAHDVAAKLSSQFERKSYYEIVLHEPAPAGVEERSIWLDLVA